MVGCSTIKNAELNRPQPNWVLQRPVNNFYYIGIGQCSKLNGNDYVQVAKKNALQDLLGEIKVTVSTNSFLSQYQNNKTFSQQFLSDIKIISEGTLEGFEVVDAYETKTDYWIYYRLNKAEYELAQQKKIQAAIDKALDFLQAADRLNEQNEFTQIFRLRVKALAAIQNYANNNLETTYKGKQVYLMNEIVNLLQRQLYLLKLSAQTDKVIAVAGKPQVNPITILVQFSGSNKPAAFVPVAWQSNQVKLTGTQQTESNSLGIAAFYINRISGNQNVQMIDFKVDVKSLFKADSFNTSMQRIIETFDAPGTKVQFLVEPIKIFTDVDEQNLNKKLDFNIIETALKNRLNEFGCTFVRNEKDADYTLHIRSNTKNEGNIWGNMLQSSIEVRIWLTDNKSNAEVFKDGVKDLKGFQLTPEKAGLDAYNNAVTEINKSILPKLQSIIVFD